MDHYLHSLIKEYSDDEILHICKLLNKSYNIYDPDDVRWSQIGYVLNKTSSKDIIELRHNCLSNKIVNDLIFNFYYCERVIKYHFINYLRRSTNHIVAFEMTIRDSRIDICRINGCSYAYEIKTEYDSFDRLQSQMQDYIKTFEKVYVIVPFSRVNDIRLLIPKTCGIISYRISDHTVFFSYIRKAYKNHCNIYSCIDSLSSHDLSFMLKQLGETDYKTKQEKKEHLEQIANNKSLWRSYRQLLKYKYEHRWKFLTEHFDEILPIDIQCFFSSNIEPDLLYKK